jgi:oligoendopeptidase F
MPATTARPYVPAELDATDWSRLEPLYRGLVDRPLKCKNCLENLILDRSELDAATAEAEANLYIAMTCRTDDASRQAAFTRFIENVEPNVRKVAFELDRKIVTSPFARELDQARWGVLLRRLAVDVELFREANIPLQTEITKLDQEYSTICGAMNVEFDGAKRTLAQMSRYLEETDRAVRESAWRTIADRREADADRIDDLFDRLVAKRHEVARNAGFANFRDFQHRKLQRFDYRPEDCFGFHDAVAEVCVPALHELNADRARNLGLGSLRPWDLAVDERGRPPLRPFRDGQELFDRTAAVFRELDPELASMFGTLAEGDCLDLESRPGKAPGGYQYQRQRSRLPFIFMNAAGLHRDLVTMVHEAGHAFHSILCKGDPVLEYRGSPIEFAEVASTSMELLTLPHLERFYSPADANRARRERLEKFPSLMPWIAQIDAFQHWIYTNPGHARKDRTAEWMRLNARFGSRVDWSGLERFAERSWQRQLHLFGMPFYYIEYGIAETGAMQVWLQSRTDRDRALANYKKGLALGGSRPLPELWEAAGCRWDFGPGIIRELMGEVRREMAAIPA